MGSKRWKVLACFCDASLDEDSSSESKGLGCIEEFSDCAGLDVEVGAPCLQIEALALKLLNMGNEF